MAIRGDVSDLDVLQYGGNPILPQRDSYTVKGRGGVVTSDIAGGLNRQYVQFMNAPYTVTVTYLGLDMGAAYFLDQFFDRNRGQKFIATLLIGGMTNDQFVVQTVGDWSLKTTGHSGSISVSLQVEPAVDHCFNDWAFDWFQCQSASDFCEMNKYLKEGLSWL